MKTKREKETDDRRGREREKKRKQADSRPGERGTTSFGQALRVSHMKF